MSLNYDFDIHWIIPKELFNDPQLGETLQRVAPGANTRGNYVALFRDPATVQALKNGDPVLREYLESAGFGWNVSGQRLPKGTFRMEDEDAHTDVLARLRDNLGQFDLKGRDLSGFDFAAFSQFVRTVRPFHGQRVSTGRKRRGTPAGFVFRLVILIVLAWWAAGFLP